MKVQGYFTMEDAKLRKVQDFLEKQYDTSFGTTSQMINQAFDFIISSEKLDGEKG
jgi:hypothetical protein